MNHYEMLYAISDKIDSDAKKAVIEKFKPVTESFGGTVEVNEWGTRKLAYPIKTKTTGEHQTAHYILMKFEAPPEAPAEIERQMRNADEVLRFMTERVD